MTENVANRLELLDRLADRVPELDLNEHEIEWVTIPEEGSEALLVDGWGGGYFALAGDDVHAVGGLDALAPGYVGCVVIQPDGSRYLAHAAPDPLADQNQN